MKPRKSVSSRRVGLSGLCAVAMLLGAFGIQSLEAQQPSAVKRNILLKQDMTIAGREAVMASVELPPGSAEVRHTHPAETYGFVQEGTISLEIEGKPTATLTAGDVFYIPPETIHRGTNTGRVTAKLAVVFVAEKGKPLTTPVQ